MKSDPYEELINPAMHGTRNVLSSVAKSKDTVKRIVLTSSVAGENPPPPPPPPPPPRAGWTMRHNKPAMQHVLIASKTVGCNALSYSTDVA